MKQLLLDIAPSSSPTLENFVPGHNIELLQALEDILEGREQERFVYLWGGKGCGKSHLLQAVVETCTQNKLDAIYIKCGFTPNINAKFSGIGEVDCLAIDDVDHLAASEQIGLFNLFNDIRDEGHALMLVCGPAAPAQLPLREDLVTRLGWGLVYQIHELSDEEKIQAMKSHATSRGFDLPQDVCVYLLRHGQRDFPSLMATLNALDLCSLTNQRQITIPMVRELILSTS